MKKVVSVFLCVLFAIPLISCGSKNDYSKEYKYHTDEYSIVIDEYIGSSKAVDIPERIDGLEVCAINIEAFSKKKIESVSVPKTVKMIGERAFAECPLLREIKLSEGLITIRDQAFYKCPKLEDLILPEGTKYIWNYIASECESLRSVTIPSTVEGGFGLAKESFSACPKLSEVKLTDGIKSLRGFYSLTCDTSLESITIPASVESIDYENFVSCTSLKAIYFCGNAPKAYNIKELDNMNVVLYRKAGSLSWGDAPYTGYDVRIWE